MNITIILTIGVLVVAFLLLAVRILLKKNGRFSSEHIGENRRMRQDGISCAAAQDRKAQQASPRKIDVKQL